MDFFEHQEKAQKKTGVLIIYFVLAIVLIIIWIYLLLALVLQQNSWNLDLFLWVSGCTLAVIFFGSLSKSMELDGGAAVALSLGGQKISSVSANPAERKLLNVVEEMSIASGVPMPEVYVLQDEQGINAFAAGTSSHDAVIGVTKGCIQNLTRDELQGVIGHEFSHILNGDMKLNIRLMGWIAGILCLTIIGRVFMRNRSSGRKEGNALPLIGLILVVVGYVGVFFARLIKSAVSRQREFLADASSVQFTRNPSGLTGALKKIGGWRQGSQIEAPSAEDASHFFFGNGLVESWFGLMSTHPPLEDRIRAIDPTFDGGFPPTIPLEEDDEDDENAVTDLEWMSKPSTVVSVGENAAGFPSNVGRVTDRHLSYAADMMQVVPPALLMAARETSGSCSLVYALLLSPDENIRKKQITLLPELLAKETQRFFEITKNLETRLKLPVVNLSMEGLRNMSLHQYQVFQKTTDLLIDADRQVDLFEFTIRKMVEGRLASWFQPLRLSRPRSHSRSFLEDDGVVLLSMLARYGHSEMEAAQVAYDKGMKILGLPSNQKLRECSLDSMDTALNNLVVAAPAIKKRILDACAQTVASDGLIHEQEAELLRAVSDSLGCPIPPFIKGV